MKQRDFDTLVEDFLDEVRDKLKAKGEDYVVWSGTTMKTGSTAHLDRLNNFRIAANLIKITPQQDLAALVTKHILAFYDWVKGKEFQCDTLREKLTDIAAYMVLAYALNEDEKFGGGQ